MYRSSRGIGKIVQCFCFVNCHAIIIEKHLNRMKLIQKVGFNKKEFELINDSEIIIKETSLLSSKEWSVDIEYIGHRKLVETNSRKGVQIIGTIFILIAIVCWITIFVEENLNGGIDGLIWGGLFMLLLGIICFKAPMDNKVVDIQI